MFAYHFSLHRNTSVATISIAIAIFISGNSKRNMYAMRNNIPIMKAMWMLMSAILCLVFLFMILFLVVFNILAHFEHEIA